MFKLHSNTVMADSARETQLAALSEKRVTNYANIEFPLSFNMKPLTFPAVAVFAILAYDTLLDIDREVSEISALVKCHHQIDFRQYKYIWR